MCRVQIIKMSCSLPGKGIVLDRLDFPRRFLLLHVFLIFHDWQEHRPDYGCMHFGQLLALLKRK